MRREIDLDRFFEINGGAVSHIEALAGLLHVLESEHFIQTYDGALLEAGEKDEKKGAFIWLYTHYNRAAACVRAASILADNLKIILEGMEEALVGGDTDKAGEDTHK